MTTAEIRKLASELTWNATSSRETICAEVLNALADVVEASKIIYADDWREANWARTDRQLGEALARVEALQ